MAADPAPHPGAYRPPNMPATWAHFGKVLGAIGGNFVGVVSRDACAPALARIVAAHSSRLGKGRGRRCVASKAVVPLLNEVGGWVLAADAAADPHGLADVELGILWAEAAVAENAALLFSTNSLPERALGFLAQHLLVLVADGALHPDLVTAQAALSLRFPASLPHHVTWMSGPSKTADIEQTLVIGAHGARSLTVLAIAP